MDFLAVSEPIKVVRIFKLFPSCWNTHCVDLVKAVLYVEGRSITSVLSDCGVTSMLDALGCFTLYFTTWKILAILNVDSEIHFLYCLHYVFLTRINHALNTFTDGWITHCILATGTAQVQ